MQNKFKKALSITLAVLMLMASVPLAGFVGLSAPVADAEQTSPEELLAWFNSRTAELSDDPALAQNVTKIDATLDKTEPNGQYSGIFNIVSIRDMFVQELTMNTYYCDGITEDCTIPFNELPVIENLGKLSLADIQSIDVTANTTVDVLKDIPASFASVNGSVYDLSAYKNTPSVIDAIRLEIVLPEETAVKNGTNSNKKNTYAYTVNGKVVSADTVLPSEKFNISLRDFTDNTFPEVENDSSSSVIFDTDKIVMNNSVELYFDKETLKPIACKYVCAMALDQSLTMSGDFGDMPLFNGLTSGTAGVDSEIRNDHIYLFSDYYPRSVNTTTDGIQYAVIADKAIVVGYNGSATDLAIPSAIDGYPVTSIGTAAFESQTTLNSVTVPDSVTSIGFAAFQNCTNLADVYYSGSEEQWKNISISSQNTSLTNATIHYNCSESVSEFKYHQTHVVDNYQANNNKYESEYFFNKAVAMDGSGGTPDLCIPGLTKEDNLVPQGITYYPEKNWVLISAYSKNANTPSVIFALDNTTGDYVAEFEIYKTGGDVFTGHLGGIATSANNLYLTNGKKISYIPLSAFNVAEGTTKKVEIKDSYTTYLGNDGASVSFLSITDGYLYAGNFYNESDDYDTPANPYFNSVVFGYKLSGSSSSDEWNNYIASAESPDIEFYIPDEINEIQCATVKDRKLYLSASYGRQNDSRLYVVGVSTVQQQTFDYADLEYVGLPMMEGMTFINDDLYVIFESGAYFYREKDASYKAKNPTDVVWKICVPETNIYNMGEETYNFANFGDFHSRGGHCFGMSMTSSGYYRKELDVSDVGLKAINTVYTLDKTSAVKKPICYYQDIQGSYALGATVAGGSYYRYETYDIESDWSDVVNYVKNHEYDNKGSLQIGFRKNGEGGHAINFLRYEEINGEPRIYVYDNNFPDTETYFYEDLNGNILQAPYSTFSGAIDCIALRSVEKYYDIVGDYDARKTWFSYKDKISISSTNVYPIDGNIEMGERVVFELAEDVETIIITPLVDNATFTYMNTEYSFSEIDEDTYAEFTFAETENDIPEFKIVNAPHEHVYDETKTAPTCTEQGYTTYTCSCGDTYVGDYTPVLDHDYKAVVTAPTCTAQGYTTYTCSCGDSYKDDYVDVKGHTEKIVPAVAPTCTKEGLTEGVKCADCSTVLVAQKKVAKLDHVDEDTDNKCDSCGTKVRSCDCMCHATDCFNRFFYKIIQFFRNLFGIYSECKCGIVHR